MDDCGSYFSPASVEWFSDRRSMKGSFQLCEITTRPNSNIIVEGIRIWRLKKRLTSKAGVTWALLGTVWWMGLPTGFSQTQISNPARETLEEEFVDPLTTLPQVFLKDEFSPVNYGTDVQTNQLVARILIPRIPPNTLLPFVQLIRPTFSLVTLPAPLGTRTDFGDMQLFDLAVLPWPPAATGVRLGLGPTFVFPTATSKLAGQGAWQAGPAFAAVYTGTPRLLVGFLLQNPISFAYTSSNRRSQNNLAFQPAVLFDLWDGWYLRSADANRLKVEC